MTRLLYHKQLQEAVVRQTTISPDSPFIVDLINKWLPTKNYFVIVKISPTNLVFELIIQKNFYSQTRLVGLI